MAKLILILVTAIVCLAQEHATPGDAHAAANGEPAHKTEETAEPIVWGLDLTVWKWINFGILMAGVGYLFAKQGVPFFQERAAGILKDISDAQKTKTEADARAAELESRIANLGDEIARMQADAQAEMQNEAKRMEAETAQSLAKVQASAEQEIASATKQAKAELSAHAAALAIDLAAGRIRSGLNEGQSRGLVSAFIQDLEKVKN
ncbi:MAG: ATP synthase F0 subunit B [Bryobacteraceae bacterium]|nr:ATP synthase F0 subunit B [Bryobacteraceae bacterium]